MKTLVMTVITERPSDIFPEIVIKIFPNLETMSCHKSLDTMYISFLKIALDLSFKSSIFIVG